MSKDKVLKTLKRSVSTSDRQSGHDLLKQLQLSVPKTEGIKYAGSKLKILPYIIDVISELKVKNVLDGFSGSTRVSQAFAQLGYNTTSSDISVWSETMATAYILNNKEPKHYQSIIDHLNGIKGYKGWFSEHYGGSEKNSEKRPF
ncbi:MAG TPA: DNA adenine methylase, partial [Bacteroidia bacterium]|nr:DNA adenine methylase [Bacteroidia bacterium]